MGRTLGRVRTGFARSHLPVPYSAGYCWRIRLDHRGIEENHFARTPSRPGSCPWTASGNSPTVSGRFWDGADEGNYLPLTGLAKFFGFSLPPRMAAHLNKVNTAGEFVWAVRGAGFRPSKAPNSPRLRLIGRRREFASSIKVVETPRSRAVCRARRHGYRGSRGWRLDRNSPAVSGRPILRERRLRATRR